jgi:hypothetical protein
MERIDRVSSAIVVRVNQGGAKPQVDVAAHVGGRIHEQTTAAIHPGLDRAGVGGQKRVERIRIGVSAFHKDERSRRRKERHGIDAFVAQIIPIAGAKDGIHGVFIRVHAPRLTDG